LPFGAASRQTATRRLAVRAQIKPAAGNRGVVDGAATGGAGLAAAAEYHMSTGAEVLALFLQAFGALRVVGNALEPVGALDEHLHSLDQACAFVLGQ